MHVLAWPTHVQNVLGLMIIYSFYAICHALCVPHNRRQKLTPLRSNACANGRLWFIWEYRPFCRQNISIFWLLVIFVNEMRAYDYDVCAPVSLPRARVSRNGRSGLNSTRILPATSVRLFYLHNVLYMPFEYVYSFTHFYLMTFFLWQILAIISLNKNKIESIHVVPKRLNRCSVYFATSYFYNVYLFQLNFLVLFSLQLFSILNSIWSLLRAFFFF